MDTIAVCSWNCLCSLYQNELPNGLGLIFGRCMRGGDGLHHSPPPPRFPLLPAVPLTQLVGRLSQWEGKEKSKCCIIFPCCRHVVNVSSTGAQSVGFIEEEKLQPAVTVPVVDQCQLSGKPLKILLLLCSWRWSLSRCHLKQQLLNRDPLHTTRSLPPTSKPTLGLGQQRIS